MGLFQPEEKRRTYSGGVAKGLIGAFCLCALAFALLAIRTQQAVQTCPATSDSFTVPNVPVDEKLADVEFCIDRDMRNALITARRAGGEVQVKMLDLHKEDEAKIFWNLIGLIKLLLETSDSPLDLKPIQPQPPPQQVAKPATKIAGFFFSGSRNFYASHYHHSQSEW